MRKLIVLAALATLPAHADIFATGGIKGDSDGKTVLLTDACSLDLAKFERNHNLSLGDAQRAFYYTGEGLTQEGCWKSEAGSVVLVWPAENILRRWPIRNFKLERRDW